MPVESGTAWRSRLWLWGPVIGYMSLVFFLSSMSSPPSPVKVNDKVEHFVFYGGLALLVLRAVAGGRLAGVTPRACVLAWCIATAYGATDEFHQWFVPGRSAELADLAADAFGAATAMVAARAGGIILRSRLEARGH